MDEFALVYNYTNIELLNLDDVIETVDDTETHSDKKILNAMSACRINLGSLIRHIIESILILVVHRIIQIFVVLL